MAGKEVRLMKAIRLRLWKALIVRLKGWPYVFSSVSSRDASKVLPRGMLCSESRTRKMNLFGYVRRGAGLQVHLEV